MPNGAVAVVYCASVGGNGQVVYGDDNGGSWIKPAEDRGFQYDPLAYYPDACVLQYGSLFAAGSHERLGKNKYGPAGAEVTSMRFRIKGPKEGIGIQLLPVAETSPCPPEPANTGANHVARGNTQTTH